MKLCKDLRQFYSKRTQNCLCCCFLILIFRKYETVSLVFLQLQSNRNFDLHSLTCQIVVQQILLFLGGKKTYTTLLGPKRLLILEIFPSKPDFHLHK